MCYLELSRNAVMHVNIWVSLNCYFAVLCISIQPARSNEEIFQFHLEIFPAFTFSFFLQFCQLYVFRTPLFCSKLIFFWFIGQWIKSMCVLWLVQVFSLCCWMSTQLPVQQSSSEFYSAGTPWSSRKLDQHWQANKLLRYKQWQPLMCPLYLLLCI